jgi:hypothetical protein
MDIDRLGQDVPPIDAATHPPKIYAGTQSTYNQVGLFLLSMQ